VQLHVKKPLGFVRAAISFSVCPLGVRKIIKCIIHIDYSVEAFFLGGGKVTSYPLGSFLPTSVASYLVGSFLPTPSLPARDFSNQLSLLLLQILHFHF